MELLNHLKDEYRARYCRKEGKTAAIREGNVLKYIEDCFETCDKEFIVCSPSISCCSSPPLDQDQVPSCSKEKDTGRQPDKIAYVRNAFDRLISLPSPDNKDRSSGSDESEGTETRSQRRISYLNKDVALVSLGSPALLEEAEVEAEVEVEEKEQEKEESCCAKKTTRVESEDECEFFIEESFGVSSSSWISESQRTRKPGKNIAVSSERKKRANHVKDKRSKTFVAPILIKQTPAELTSVAKRTINGPKNPSATAVVEKQSESPVNIQEGRKEMHSQSKLSLMEQDHTFPVQPQAAPSSSQWPSQRKKSKKQKFLDAEPSVEAHSDDLPDSVSIDLHAKNLIHVLKHNHDVSKIPQSEESMAEHLSLSKKRRKRVPSKMKSSGNVCKKKNRESITKDMPSEDCQEPADTNTHLGDSASVLKCSFSECQPATVLTTQRQPLRKQLRREPVSATKRKQRALVSEEDSEEDGSNGLGGKGGENSQEGKTAVPRKTFQKPRHKYLVCDDSDGNESYREDSPALVEERLNVSTKQQNSKTHSPQLPHASDVNRNNVSGPLSNSKDSSTNGMSFNQEVSSSEDSEFLEENTDAYISNSMKHKLILPTNTPNVRRTKRMRLKPLEYWRGERVQYKTRPSGGCVVSGIISPEQVELRRSKPKRTIKPAAELEIMPDTTFSFKDLSQPAVVFDAESNQEVLLKCVSSGSSHSIFVSNETVSIYKYLTTCFFSAGKMILKPLKEKGFQYSYTDTLVFHIVQGKLLLVLYDQGYHLSAGDYFFIPPGNIYNVRNLLNKECVILFTQLKGTRPEDK